MPVAVQLCADQPGKVIGLEIRAKHLRDSEAELQVMDHAGLRQIAFQKGLLLWRVPAMPLVLGEDFLTQ